MPGLAQLLEVVGQRRLARRRTAAPARRRRPCRRACAARRRAAGGPGRRAPWRSRPSARPRCARRRGRRPARSTARPRGASASARAPDRQPSIYIYRLNRVCQCDRLAQPWTARSRLGRRAGAEGLAAFALVFAGCGAIVADAALRRRARRGRRQPRLRAGHHGDGLRHRPPVGRAHQPRGDVAFTAHAPLPGARGGRLRRRPVRRRDRRGARCCCAVWTDKPGATWAPRSPPSGPAAHCSTRSC